MPLALTNYQQNTGQLTSHGAHHERFERDRTTKLHTIPYNYVIYQTNITNTTDHNTNVTSTIKLHNANYRPLNIQMTPKNVLTNQLNQNHLNNTTKTYDKLVTHYLTQYQNTLRNKNNKPIIHTPIITEFETAHQNLLNTPELQTLLPKNLLQSKEITLCAQPKIHQNETQTSLNLTTHLLNHPNQPTKHITLMKTNIIPNTTNLNYDTHISHVEQSSTNIIHFFKQFTKHITQPNKKNLTKIDLNKTIIILNTEFNQSPSPKTTPTNPNNTNLDH